MFCTCRSSEPLILDTMSNKNQKYIFFIIFSRNLCVEIGEKTNVYTLEVSMHGHELYNDDPAEENEVLPYSEEECKYHSFYNF